MIPENIAFWLMPAAREQRFFATLIRNLALRFDAPIFEPHLTLHDGKLQASVAADALQKIPTQRSYQLQIKEIDFSEAFTRTLFVRFSPSDSLIELRDAIGETLRLPAADNFDPHLSLIYKDLPLSEKEDLARATKIPWRVVSFDALAVIAHPPEINSRADVQAWRILARRSLIAG